MVSTMAKKKTKAKPTTPARQGRPSLPMPKGRSYFACKLFELREARKLTLRELEAITKVNHEALRKYERGVREPTLTGLHAIAVALGVPLVELIDPSWL